ncbi:hypothetical protein FXN63_20690 [Pigmentiphaga aceris]|uniref:Uncharacterized protein n=1 Tax=Pigmentiphaga aceris TaxID=1940612 RepID=A0A5C0B251_9BURK|nr:hypothetical protein [Pigmentiphaga aceris]QEI07984.1 hypothetical protein FXN63_20690 [Pigmentiphaga aceris]
MPEDRATQGGIRRFFAANTWVAYGAAYLVGLFYTAAGASNLFTALFYGYVDGKLGPLTFDSDPADFVIKVAISGLTTLVLGTVVIFATVGWLHVWRQKWRSRQRPDV